MVNTNKLKGAMLSAGYEHIEDAAKAIGMHPQTMYRKLRQKSFGSEEMEAMVKVYGIPESELKTIFFAGL